MDIKSISQGELARLSEANPVVGFMIGADERGIGCVLKLKTAADHDFSYFMQADDAFRLSVRLRRTARKLRWPSDPYPNVMPEITASDWDIRTSLIGLNRIEIFSDWMIWAISDQTLLFRVFRMPTGLALEMSQVLWDLYKTTAQRGSTSLH